MREKERRELVVAIQVEMRIDQAGQHRQPWGLEDFCTRGNGHVRARASRGDAVAGHKDGRVQHGLTAPAVNKSRTDDCYGIFGIWHLDDIDFPYPAALCGRSSP